MAGLSSPTDMRVLIPRLGKGGRDVTRSWRKGNSRSKRAQSALSVRTGPITSFQTLLSSFGHVSSPVLPACGWLGRRPFYYPVLRGNAIRLDSRGILSRSGQDVFPSPWLPPDQLAAARDRWRPVGVRTGTEGVTKNYRPNWASHEVREIEPNQRGRGGPEGAMES